MPYSNLREFSRFDLFGDEVAAGKDVWVEFINEKESRCGSIGKLRVGKADTKSKNLARSWYYIITALVEFPGTTAKPIELAFDAHKLEKIITWKRGYSGVAKRVNTPRNLPVTAPKLWDRYGVEIVIGEFIAFCKADTMDFGTVRRITPKGTIFIELIGGFETSIHEAERCVVIQKDFRDQMMLRKLSV